MLVGVRFTVVTSVYDNRPAVSNAFAAAAWRRNRRKLEGAPSAGVAELVDALGLGPNASRHGGSSPSARTILLARIAGQKNAKAGRAPAT